MRTVIERPEIHTMRRHVQGQRVAPVIDRDLAVHVGAGQVEHYDRRTSGWLRPPSNPMQANTIEGRGASLLLEDEFINAVGCSEGSRASDGGEGCWRWRPG